MSYDRVLPYVFLGNGRSPYEVADYVNHVITVAEGADNEHTTEYIPLETGSGNDEDEFRRAVEATKEAIESGTQTLVHCHEGKERSPTILACAMCELDRTEHETWADALSTLQNRRKLVDPTPELRDQAERWCRC